MSGLQRYFEGAGEARMNIRLYEISNEVRELYVPNKEDDLPYIGLEHVEQGTLHISNVGSSQEVESHKLRFRTGDILFGTLRPYFRKVIIAPFEGVCSTEFCVVRPKESDDRYFVLYRMADAQFIKYATANSNGARPRTKWKLFSDFEFPQLPPIQRKKIGDILFAYDDLIENNRRRIQLLEQAAREMYREWFVRLRFPGYKHTKIKDGVPEGWEIKRLGDYSPLVYGKSLKKDDHIPGPYPVYGSSGIVGTHKTPLVTGPAIIVGRKGNVGNVFWSENDFHPIDTVYYIVREHCTTHLYYAILNTQFISTDVAVPGLNRDYAHSRKLLIPDAKILGFFEEHTKVIRNQIDLLVRHNDALTKARDLLLPYLVNGVGKDVRLLNS